MNLKKTEKELDEKLSNLQLKESEETHSKKT
jgi:hypothetical protein